MNELEVSSIVMNVNQNMIITEVKIENSSRNGFAIDLDE